MMSKALRPLSKNKEPKNPRLTNTEILAGAATIVAGAGADGTSGRCGQGGYGGRGGGSGQGGQKGRRKWPDTGHTANENTGERPPGKKKIAKSCTFCVAKKET